ncbi:MAG: phosphatase PAP2 family protein [Thaumarchaeota archaeon]|nr:phosphatase PAP2 family protein [Nitrososphaerota archaeon]
MPGSEYDGKKGIIGGDELLGVKSFVSWRQSVGDAAVTLERTWQRHRTLIFQGCLIGAAIVLICLSVFAHTVPYFAFDVTTTRAVQAFEVGWFDALMRALSWIGYEPQVTVISVAIILYLYAGGHKRETIVTATSAVSSAILSLIFKLLVERPRPSANLVRVTSELTDFSFPSGHVLYFTAFFGFLLFLAYTLLKHSWCRTLVLFILGGIIGLIGLSRVYLGQHWASDVIASYLLGSLWLAMIIFVYRWLKVKQETDENVNRT